MSYHFAAYQAQQELKAAARAISEAADIAHFPHLLGQAIRHTNAALRKLAAAQFRLLQAEARYKKPQENPKSAESQK